MRSLLLLGAALLGACAPIRNAPGVYPEFTQVLDCAQDLAEVEGFGVAPYDHALGQPRLERRELLQWSPVGPWQRATEMHRISVWVVPTDSVVRVRAEALTRQYPSPDWVAGPDRYRDLAARIQTACRWTRPAAGR